MFGKKLVGDMITRSAENATDRRRFLQSAGALGLGIAGAGVLRSGTALAEAGTEAMAGPSDGAVLNFALNLEYLEAEFYSYAVHGHGLSDGMTTGTGRRGGVTGGKQVPFKTSRIRQYATEIAADELAHVKFLRSALGSAAVSRPAINIRDSFTAAARAAKLIGMHDVFDPYANENNFLLAAFLFEDVGVTAYKGAAPLITNKTYLEAAAGILSAEAYHAATIRSSLWEKDMGAQVAKLSAARNMLDGNGDDDQGIGGPKMANINPTDKNGINFSRSYDRVLNIVYLNPNKVTKGGFYPWGVNGSLNTSS
ncbi:ferritin-like domain-containing protein [Actinoplanes bogorensis]|uniref:Ferritin-like domain-containing protein n=1 Tax=Paractinoplanes bogorensis TaxID=1610840 RepID=A0ABS5YRV0_9ACTN|nr:ferritin-like domain-containing protein [Actinoplanes bogorensis]MBU2666175.1 ferritin-like domain-containing protein [Actinoplanes bogorensis]